MFIKCCCILPADTDTNRLTQNLEAITLYLQALLNMLGNQH